MSDGIIPDGDMAFFESGPFCEHWSDPDSCEDCARKLLKEEILDACAKAWEEGRQAHQNDLGAVDVTPNPYKRKVTP